MGYSLLTCIASCYRTNSSSKFIGNDVYNLQCITQCPRHQVLLYHNTTEKYTHILQMIAVILITLGLFGKIFNGIIFLRKPLRGTSTGLFLLLKTIFDTILLLWLFIFDTKFFVTSKQINSSGLICLLSRSSDIFISLSIGFIILACAVRLVTIRYSKHLSQVTCLHVFLLILLMILCGLAYNWHIFYYPKLVTITLNDNKNHSITYCNVLFGRHMGYLSFGGFQTIQEFLYNSSIVNFLVSSLIPLIIVALTNIFLIVYVLKSSSKHISRINLDYNDALISKDFYRSDSSYSSFRYITKKDIIYEITIILITNCIFLITNGIANTYVYVKISSQSNRPSLTEYLKISNIYLILRMLSLIGIVLEFYMYFFIAKKFREDVYHVIEDIIQYKLFRYCFKCTHPSSTIERQQINNKYISTQLLKTDDNHIDSSQRQKMLNIESNDLKKVIDTMESIA